jgi:hypothetical protein
MISGRNRRSSGRLVAHHRLKVAITMTFRRSLLLRNYQLLLLAMFLRLRALL